MTFGIASKNAVSNTPPGCVSPSSPTMPGAVDRKHEMNVLQRRVVDDLIIGTLQECGVNRKDREPPPCRQTAAERDGVFLRNADIEESGRETGRKTGKPGSELHCRRHGTDMLVFFCQLTQQAAEHGREIVSGNRRFPCCDVETVKRRETRPDSAPQTDTLFPYR